MQDIKSIYQQNNYQSQILYTISKQIDIIENKINDNENNKLDHRTQHPFSTTTYPIFKPIKRQIKFFENEILKSISTRLDRLDKNKWINTIDEDDNESIQTTAQSENDIQEINRIKNKSKKPYYPRHTPPDLLFEEHHKYSSNEYTGESIHEWNIDGRLECEMMNLFQEMRMAAMAYKGKGNDDKQACVLLVVGFTGALRYWWDNSLDTITQDSIINHVEIRQQEDEEGFMHDIEVPNAVEVLIHTLTMHFIGNNNAFYW